MSIKYCTYKEIDKIKWDDCINQSVNGLIYAKSFYLDAMAENWDALILNDYEAVMPLTWKKKWGITYLYQPAFIQQGGIFFKIPLTKELVQAFTQEAFRRFPFAEITFNYANDLSGVKFDKLIERNNFILPLFLLYEQIYAGYPGSITKNLKRTKQFELKYITSNDYAAVLRLYEKLYTARLPYFSKKDFSNFSRLCGQLYEKGLLIIRSTLNKNNELVAAVVLLKDGNRLYNIISCVTEKGKAIEANYFLYDQVIREFSQSDYILDFEGSDVKGIADFYSRFPVTNQKYPFVKVNNLPFLIKLFKR